MIANFFLTFSVFAERPELVLEQTHSVSRSEVAAVTMLTYDIMINFADEIELVWKSHWNPVKAMYIAARYLPWLFQLALLAIEIDGTTGLFFSSHECSKWQIVQAVILQLTITTVDVILLMRVYALFNRNRILLVVFTSLFIAEISYMCYVLSVVTPRLEYNSECFVTHSPSIFITFWIVSLSFETLLFALTLFKFVVAVKVGWGKRPVMKQFVSDGTWAYALIFLTMFINSMLYKLVHNPLAGICYTWLLSVLSFAGSRLILNPRRRTRGEWFQSIDTLGANSGGIFGNPSQSSNSKSTTTNQVDIELSPISPRSSGGIPRLKHSQSSSHNHERPSNYRHGFGARGGFGGRGRSGSVGTIDIFVQTVVDVADDDEELKKRRYSESPV
ncbi:hypothetical protein C8Q75DRAFT_804702 [Abortiporus biennis]|nr:hypothetical protein C8Q75DRAFT_804702 [Abortiporus biennis]